MVPHRHPFEIPAAFRSDSG
uniref:Uncharacterized protein n=1 Tax=Anopheles funestus TaxID=62324 RepID=A0A182S0N4_ANOFN